MRTILLVIFTLLLKIGSSAQQMIWNESISVVNQQLEFPKATVVGKIDADIPGDGTVVVRFDGFCSSSPGDRIILAASDFDGWQSNFGNLGVAGYDINNNAQSFSHSRTYTVNKGLHSFFAVAHNFVDTEGNGLASINGQLTVEFYPAASTIMLSSGIGNVKYPLVMGTGVVLLDSLSLNTNAQGSVLLNMDGSYYSLNDNETEIAINDKPVWPSEGESIKVSIAKTYITKCFVLRRKFEISEGNHLFYILARKSKGDFETTQNAFYYNFIATFSPIESVVVAGNVAVTNNLPTQLAHISFEAPSNGKLLVHTTGSIRQNGRNSLLFEISDNTLTSIKDTTLLTHKIHENYDSEFFSASRVFEVEKGLNEIYFYGAYAEGASTPAEASIQGLMTLQFASNEVISATVNGLEESESLQIYPNPGNGIIQLYYKATDQHSNLLTVTDMKGSVVLKEVIGAENKTSLDISHLPAGLYVVTMQSGSKSVSGKFIKW